MISYYLRAPSFRLFPGERVGNLMPNAQIHAVRALVQRGRFSWVERVRTGDIPDILNRATVETATKVARLAAAAIIRHGRVIPRKMSTPAEIPLLGNRYRLEHFQGWCKDLGAPPSPRLCFRS